MITVTIYAAVLFFAAFVGVAIFIAGYVAGYRGLYDDARDSFVPDVDMVTRPRPDEIGDYPNTADLSAARGAARGAA